MHQKCLDSKNQTISMQNLQRPVITPVKTLAFYSEPTKHHSNVFETWPKKSEFKQKVIK